MNSEFKLPFNTYDFFGYLLPGTLFALGLGGIFFDETINFCKKNFWYVSETPQAIFFILIAIAILYFLGHIIGCIGHIVYDRMIVRNILGYPFYLLLKLGDYRFRNPKTISFLLIGAFLFFLITPILKMACNKLSVCSLSPLSLFLDHWKLYIFILAFLLFEFAVFLVNCIPTIKKIKKSLGLQEVVWVTQSNSPPNKLQKLIFYAKKLIRIPNIVFFKFTATDCYINKTIRSLFFEKLTERTGLSEEDLVEYNSDAYWLTYIDLTKAKNQSHQNKISNWLDLYGCLRNYSCAFLILAVVVSIQLWYCILWESNSDIPYQKIIILIASIFLSFLLFVRYWIMYYSYYSKYIIRAYALEDFPCDESKVKKVTKGIASK